MLPNTPFVTAYYLIYAIALKSIGMNIIEFKKGRKVVSFVLLVLIELIPNSFFIFSGKYVTGYELFPIYIFPFQFLGMIVLYYWAEGNVFINFIKLWLYGHAYFYTVTLQIMAVLDIFMPIDKPLKAYSSVKEFPHIFVFMIACTLGVILSIILHRIIYGYCMNIFKSMCIAFVLLIMEIFISIIASAQMSHETYHVSFYPAAILHLTSFLLTALFLVILNQKTVKRNRLAFVKMCNNTSQNILNIYDHIMESQNSIRMWRHDVANHISVLDSLKISPELIAKTTELIDTKTAAPVQTHNPVLDTLINLKIEKANEKKIDIRTEVFYPSSDNYEIENVDLICLFSNLLDNAIEAAEKVENKKRFIDLKVTPQYNLLYINIENSTDKAPKTDSGKYLSDKPNPSEHGFGTQIINKIVHKYAGEITCSNKKETMNVEIILSMTDKLLKKNID